MRDIRDMEANAARVAALSPEARARYDAELHAHRVGLGLEEPSNDKLIDLARVAAGRANLNREERALLDGRADAIAAELLAERLRQMGEEGWTLKHDERHDHAELALASAAYAFSATTWPLPQVVRQWILQHLWPWFSADFKPKDPRRDLVRAGALAIAAIERYDREHIQAADMEAG